MTGGSPSGRIRLGRGGEFDVIRDILADGGEPGPRIRIGPGDDALVLRGGWVVSCDLSMEGVHFRREWLDLREMGYRAAAAALSDLAAMAAEVEGVLVSIAASAEDGAYGVMEVAAGAREAASAVGGAILGGDLSASVGPLVVDVVALGRTEQPVSRVGAGPGDTVWVTGTLGGASGAVRAWARGREPTPSQREAFSRPVPRIAEARWLVDAARIHALIDVSDGIAGDAGHLAAAGGVRIVLEADAIPVHPELRDAGREHAEVEEPDADLLELSLRGGEDYELLFAAARDSIEPVQEEFRERFGVALTAVGRVEEGEGVFLEGPSREGGEIVPLEGGGYSHFTEKEDGDRPGASGIAEAPGARGAAE